VSATRPTRSGLLGAILINPAAGAGTTTISRLELVRDLLGCEQVRIENLLTVATRSVLEITKAGAQFEDWEAARPGLSSLISDSDQLLLGWGLGGGFGGPARDHFAAQVTWIEHQISLRRDRPLVWTVGNGPRHPSRWHQYVADKHRRTRGGHFRNRLRDVLVESSAAYIH